MRGAEYSGLLLRLLDDAIHEDVDLVTLEKWEMDDWEIKLSSSNRIWALYKEIEVLVKAKDIAVLSRKNLQTEITQRQAERNALEMSLLKAIAFKKVKVIHSLRQKILQLEGRLGQPVQACSKCRMTLQNDGSDVRAINLAGKFKEMESEIKRKLLEKEVLMDLTRKKDEADRLQLKEAHKLGNPL